MQSYDHYTNINIRYEFDHMGKRGYLNRLRCAMRKTIAHKKQLMRRNDPFICKEIFGRTQKQRLDKLRLKYLRY